MGRKPIRAWQQVCFCLALLVHFLGCGAIEDLQRHREVREALASGDQLLSRGDFDGSLKAFAGAAEIARDQAPADAAWYKMGLIYLHPRNPQKDRHQAIGLFNRVFSRFPESSWADQAKIWVSVLNEAEETNRDLERSKETIEASRQEAEHNRQALDKSKQEIEKSRQEIERTKQILEKSRQVDIEIEQKRRERVK
jgi:tetratricopeptide (TPR) repeat protein